MPSSARRWLAPLCFVALLALALGWYRLMQASLRPTAWTSGIGLFVLVVVLAVFNARKKLPILPLLKASSWMKFHTFAGWFSVGLFLLHIQFRMPNGRLEVFLALLFVAVAASGVIGLVISRALPPRLARHGEEVIFERIPALRRQLLETMEKLVLDSVAETGSSTLADLYAKRLKLYFERPADLGWHMLGSNRPLHARLARLTALDRYLNEKERSIAAAMTEHIRAKDNLDFHYACQGLLKTWLFIHIPLTYGLILVALVHGILAWTFTSSGV
jgi:hypothetical protein